MDPFGTLAAGRADAIAAGIAAAYDASHPRAHLQDETATPAPLDRVTRDDQEAP